MKTFKVSLSFVPQDFTISANTEWEALSEAKKRLASFEANGGYIPVKKSKVTTV